MACLHVLFVVASILILTNEVLLSGKTTNLPLNLDILEVTNSSIISKCVDGYLPDAFVYDFSQVSGLMLYKPAVQKMLKYHMFKMCPKEYHEHMVPKHHEPFTF